MRGKKLMKVNNDLDPLSYNKVSISFKASDTMILPVIPFLLFRPFHFKTSNSLPNAAAFRVSLPRPNAHM